jgi:hypothetical protein
LSTTWETSRWFDEKPNNEWFVAKQKTIFWMKQVMYFIIIILILFLSLSYTALTIILFTSCQREMHVCLHDRWLDFCKKKEINLRYYSYNS